MVDDRSEKAIQNDILVDMSGWESTMVFRNNTGMAWQGVKQKVRVGDVVTVTPGMVILKDARPVKFGLEGSADIIGVSHERAVAVEVKKPVSGRQSEQQGKFQRAWEKAGGIYILGRSIAEVRDKFFNSVFS